MSGVARLLVILGLLVVTTGVVPPGIPAVAQGGDAGQVVDIADIPVPVGDLPEEGYQVMTGGYLDAASAVEWVAGPRGRSTAAVWDELQATGLNQTYVLDLVLLEDRASAASDILALVQTNIFLLPDATGAGDLYGVLADYSDADIEEEEEAILDSSTVRLMSQGGDTLRTVFTRDRLVVEVVSLERFDAADAETHRNVVAHTADRAEQVLASGMPGIAPRAARLEDGPVLAGVQNRPQSGVHHLYRIREGLVQPAAGEIVAPAVDEIAPGAVQVYHASEGMQLGGGTGTGFMSTWIGEFESAGAAASFLAEVATDGPSEWLRDPYFAIAVGEQATSQGVAGLYRVTGVYDDQPYSGNLEVRQQGNHVVAIGFRTLGSVLPPVDVTSRVMDHQLACLQIAGACPPLDVADLLAAPSATPVVPAGMGRNDVVISQEFGWLVRLDVGDWTIVEQFAEPGYDVLELQSGRSLVTFESVIDQHGDPEQCVLDELGALQQFESSAMIDLGSDDENEPPAGMSPGHAWAIYTVEPLADERVDQEYTIRIDCYTIIDGGADLVVTHRAPRDEWVAEREKGQSLRDSIVLPVSVVPTRVVALTAPATADEWRAAA